MASETNTKKIGDLVLREFDSNYCRKVILLGNSVTTKIGTPLDQNGGSGGASLITNGNEANVDAVALEAVVSGAAANEPCLCLVRGPAIINGDELELETSVTVAEIKSVLDAAGILVQEEPDVAEYRPEYAS